MINFVKKDFEQLTKKELYAILKFRMEIFILEQKSFYLDMDNEDQNAMHFMGLDQSDASLICYGRVVIDQSVAQIRRVCVDENFRQKGLGSLLMEEMLAYINLFPVEKIELDAQIHLQSFYGKHGFQTIGDSYDDCGIMHVMMRKLFNEVKK